MSLAAARVRARPLLSGRAGFLALVLVYALLIAACLGTLAREGELSLGRSPIANLVKTAAEFAPPKRAGCVVRQPEPRISQRRRHFAAR